MIGQKTGMVRMNDSIDSKKNKLTMIKGKFSDKKSNKRSYELNLNNSKNRQYLDTKSIQSSLESKRNFYHNENFNKTYYI